MIKLIKDNLVKSIIVGVAAIVTIVFVVVGIIKITGDKKSQASGNNETTTAVGEQSENSTTAADDENDSLADGKNNNLTDEENTSADSSNESTEGSGDNQETTVASDTDEEQSTEVDVDNPKQPTTEAPTKAPDTSETISNEEAEEQFKESGGTYVDNSDGTVSITGGDVEGELIIPATIDGKPVELAENAFAIMGYGNDSITSVEINASVIGACAFQNCTALKTVIIGENVKEIGNGAFANCPSLETVIFKGEGVTELPEYVFMSCPKMTSITLPKSITKVHVGFITSYQPYVLEAYPEGYTGTPDYESIVPEFTLYTYSKPGEITVWSNLYGTEYTEYDGLEAIGTETRKANFKVKYLE